MCLTMKQKSKTNKNIAGLKKDLISKCELSKKDLAKLKNYYKKGCLKFDSDKTAKSILEDFKKGIIKKP